MHHVCVCVCPVSTVQCPHVHASVSSHTIKRRAKNNRKTHKMQCFVLFANLMTIHFGFIVWIPFQFNCPRMITRSIANELKGSPSLSLLHQQEWNWNGKFPAGLMSHECHLRYSPCFWPLALESVIPAVNSNPNSMERRIYFGEFRTRLHFYFNLNSLFSMKMFVFDAKWISHYFILNSRFDLNTAKAQPICDARAWTCAGTFYSRSIFPTDTSNRSKFVTFLFSISHSHSHPLVQCAPANLLARSGGPLIPSFYL